jgi:riboflavin kinase
MLEHLWFTLLALARLGAGRDSVRISTPRLADVLGISQQSASRRLRALEKKGWIRRTLVNRGQVVRVQPEGLAQLSQVRSTLELVFAEKTVVTINGRVLTGLGEGAYYVHLDGYRRQFRVKLGFDPYPGTLNIQLLTDADVNEFQMLKATAGVEIQGFASGNRSFGPVVCYPATVGSQQEAAILLIQRTHHERNVVEVIAPVNLREQLHLKDGDSVTLIARISE